MNLLEDVDVQCPFCGESFALTVDTSQGSHTTVEDCVVCCRPIAWQIAFHDFFPNALAPFPVYNRGDKLEDVWLEYAPELGSTFGDIAEKEKAGEIPSIVFSPMLVEDGRREIFRIEG